MSAPTLIIGLGGSGCKIVEKVANLVTPEQRNNIGFAVFDTDINELREIPERCPYIKIIQTSTKSTVGEYLNRDQHSRDTWFPVNSILNGKTLTEGAGQVRSISRLAFDAVLRSGNLTPLHEAIQNLYKVEEDKVEQALHVIITGSLAGGTGSGLILPVAMYVRNYLQTHHHQSANITRGFFVLPEVFYYVIPGLVEQNNLKANAYATLRELDSFLMKGDNTLEKRYENSIKMEFPIPASPDYEEYQVLPYDFVFLFDAQNAEGGKLNSFDQYLSHAANCIYAQSIGPMNRRSNSSEDNTIRKLIHEKGRNRYAGAGASLLIYPYEDIRDLIALTWVKQCVSKKWMVYDELYKEMRQEYDEQKEAGCVMPELTKSSFYASQVESSSKHEDPFAKAIYKETANYKNGVTRGTDKWVAYVSAILNKTASDLKDSKELKSKKEGILGSLSDLNKDNKWKPYVDVYKEMEEYRGMCTAYAEEISQSISYSLFKTSKSFQPDNASLDYKFETYLWNDNNEFIHPNTVRYMLIMTHERMKLYRTSLTDKLEKNRKYFENFSKNTFDDKTTDTEETVENLADKDKKTPLLEKLTKRPTSEQEEVKRKYDEYLKATDEFMMNYTQHYVLTQGMQYISKMIEAMEDFYVSMNGKIELIDKQIDDIYKKFSYSKGTTVRYVCGSKDCLDKILDKNKYAGSGISIDSKLAKNIYDKVRDYASAKEKPKAASYFSKLFDDEIVGYFTESVVKSTKESLDVDIIDALRKEAELSGKFEDKDDAENLIQMYVKKVIEDTRQLSCPFIEMPLGETRDPINACTFNSDMKPEEGDESPKSQLIKAELMNNGGQPDKEISKYMIMFYRSYYGLRANDLSKFAPPEKSRTYNRAGGEYFKAYYELVAGINPSPDLSEEVSPHIDRWWHIVTKMPDLDEDNQKKQEYEIDAAFFWAMISEYIWIPHESDAKIYKIKNIQLKMDDDTLIVSNGTPCDRLYEVMDAIAIYPKLTKRILDKVSEDTKRDIDSGLSIENGILFTALNNFKIENPGIGKDKNPSTCIFDFPLLLKKSSTPENYYEKGVLEILDVELEEIRKYLSNFYNEKELRIAMGNIIEAQFEKHLKSVAMEAEMNPDIYNQTLFVKTVDMITAYLDDLGLREKADKIRETVLKLKG